MNCHVKHTSADTNDSYVHSGLVEPAHHLCFATCDLKDEYGDMDATLMNGATCFSDAAGQHDVELADVFEIGVKTDVDEVDKTVTLLKSYTNPVVGDLRYD